jgi:hypothetical protein
MALRDYDPAGPVVPRDGQAVPGGGAALSG